MKNTVLIIGMLFPIFCISCQQSPNYFEKLRLIQSNDVYVTSMSWKQYSQHGFIKAWGRTDQREMQEIINLLVRGEKTGCYGKFHYELEIILKNGERERIPFKLAGKTFIGKVGNGCLLSGSLGVLLCKYLPPPPSAGIPPWNVNHLEELKKIDESTERELLILYRENADPNEIRQLKEYWWEKIEDEYKKHPKTYHDLNEVRKFEEDWWGIIEKEAEAQRKTEEKK